MRFEIMLKVKTTSPIPEHEVNDFLYESFKMTDCEGDYPEDASLYDIDVYDNDNNGNIVAKVLIDSILATTNDVAERITFKFEHENIVKSEFAQILEAF